MMISEWMIDNNDPADDSDASRFKIKTNQITIEMKVKDQCEEGERICVKLEYRLSHTTLN